MNTFTLENAGDASERLYYPLFISNEFPSYAIFWQNFIVPLTNRPTNVHFKTTPELAEIDRSEHDICIAQLHYSVLKHLARAYDLRLSSHVDLNQLTEGMVRLTGAQDVGFELLERHHNPRQYDPWPAMSSGGVAGSRKARREWQKAHSYPLQDIRNYRNHLVHGRVLPQVISHIPYVPRIGVEHNYFDWRIITNNPNIRTLIGTDLVPTSDVLQEAWANTIQYLESEWTNHLI